MILTSLLSGQRGAADRHAWVCVPGLPGDGAALHRRPGLDVGLLQDHPGPPHQQVPVQLHHHLVPERGPEPRHLAGSGRDPRQAPLLRRSRVHRGQGKDKQMMTSPFSQLFSIFT